MKCEEPEKKNDHQERPSVKPLITRFPETGRNLVVSGERML